MSMTENKARDREIEGWLSEVGEIKRRTWELTRRKNELLRTIRAKIEYLRLRGNTIDESVVERLEELDKRQTIADAIVTVLENADHNLSPQEIMERLPDAGITKSVNSSIYTLLTRLVKVGQIHRNKHGQYSVKK